MGSHAKRTLNSKMYIFNKQFTQGKRFFDNFQICLRSNVKKHYLDEAVFDHFIETLRCFQEKNLRLFYLNSVVKSDTPPTREGYRSSYLEGSSRFPRVLPGRGLGFGGGGRGALKMYIF